MKVSKNISIGILLLFLVINFVQHSKYLNLDIQGIHSWRQSQTMWNIRNFVRHDNSILNPRINSFNGGRDNLMRYEFPLMQWTIAQLQKGFGEHIYIVRLFIFITGLLTIFAFAYMIHHLFKDWFIAAISAIFLLYSPVFFYYTINPIPDNLALSFSMLYLACIIKYRSSNKIKYLLLASIFLLLSTLCKLPFLMVSIVSIWFFLKDLWLSKKLTPQIVRFAILQFVFLLPAFLWYAWVMPGWAGNPILTGNLHEPFILSEYLEILRYHFTTMFPHILLSIPSVVLFLLGIWAYIKEWRVFHWLLPLIGITFLYLFLELKPIGIVHDYYMLPFLLWLYIIVAFGVKKIMHLKYGGIYIIGLLAIFSCIYTPTTTAKNWSIEKSYFNPDVFVHSEALKNAVPNNEQCIILNDYSSYVFGYRVDKMGHIFHSDNLPIGWIDDMVKNYGIRYMYSDSRKVDAQPAFQKYVKQLILEKGTVKVFELKIPTSTIE